MGLGHGEQTDNNNQIQQPGTHMGNMQSRKTLRRLQSGSKFKAAKAIEQPMLPAAFKDYLTVYKGEAGKLNPLDNDYDANGDAISIENFDKTTFAGGTVTAQGNNLTYMPPADFVGVDQFTYTVTDGHYKTVGPVQIQVLNAGLVGEWDMDTVTDNKVTDLSGNGNHLVAPELDKITAVDMLADLLVGGIDNQAMSVQLLADDTKLPDALGHSLLPHKLDPGHKSFSASLWFQYSNIKDNKLLIGKSSFHPNNMQYGGWEIRTGGDSGNDLTVQVSFRDRLMVNNQMVITQSSAIAEASWHHVVLVLDREAGELRGYLDGVAFDQKGTLPEGHGPIIAAMNTSSYGGGSPFKVGGHTAVNCQPGDNEGDPEDCTVAAGQAFDHVKIYHKALTEEEVGTLYALQ